MTITCRPASESARAIAKPTTPPPMTATSSRSKLCIVNRRQSTPRCGAFSMTRDGGEPGEQAIGGFAGVVALFDQRPAAAPEGRGTRGAGEERVDGVAEL